MHRSSAVARPADNNIIGLDTKKIRELRLALGLNQTEAAKRAKLPGPQFWSDLERGRRANLTIDVLERVAKALNTHPRDLFLK